MTLPSFDRIVPLLEQTIPEVMTRLNVPGLAAAMFGTNGQEWAKGFGVSSLATGSLVTPQTVFEACSLSKPVVAYGALKLCDGGVLELDRPLSEYLTEPYIPDEPYLTQMTLRQLLSHSTGLPNWRKPDEPLRAQFAPGTRFGYSGEGYLYLQKVMEQVTGQSLADYMRTQVLGPLNMLDSSYVWVDQYDTSAALGHESDGSVMDKWKPETANAAYSLHTTASDFANFMQAVLKAQAQLPKTALVEMLTKQIEVRDALAWGLGWGLDAEPERANYWHWGDNTWFTCFACGWLAQQSGLVIMTNSVFGLQACREIVRVVMGQEHAAFGWIDSLYSGS